jgi:asparagine synthase (glutamine-hydrolysing)
LHGLPNDFESWSKLGQDQYLEIMTLFGPYLISSQGDRMLMANSVEGRFPFLDNAVMEFCNGLPASYKLCGLDEKHILKRAVRDIVPADILERKKQPYRAPDAISFVENGAPDYVEHFLSAEAVEEVGIFDARKVQALYQKLRKRAQLDQDVVFSNIDNMALVGILSTQLLLKNFGRRYAAGCTELNFTVNLWRDV